jgi:anthranilate phosphoribosyltransferase
MIGALDRLLEGARLGEGEAGDLLARLAGGDMPAIQAGAVLAALRLRGETPAELRGFARTMRWLARRPILPPGPPALDIVGTGGDGSSSLSLSTGAALLAAATGQRVVKHGNRAATGRAGSADVIEALGLALPLDEREAGRCLRACGFTFLHAPHYHPAMASLAQVRRALGVRTVFNLLGPLTNPAAPPYAVIGACSPDVAALLAETISGLPFERVFVVHGAPGWDEPTPVGPFLLFDVRPGHVQRGRRDPADLGLRRCAAVDLVGGDAAFNARSLAAVLRGERGAHRDALVLGAALGLEVAGAVPMPLEARAAAEAAIDDGRAARLLDGLAHFDRDRTAATARPARGRMMRG